MDWNVIREDDLAYIRIRNTEAHDDALRIADGLLARAHRRVMSTTHEPISLARFTGRIVEIDHEARKSTFLNGFTPWAAPGFPQLVDVVFTVDSTLMIARPKDTRLEGLLLAFDDDQFVFSVTDCLGNLDGLRTNLFRAYELVAIDLATNGENPRLANQKQNIDKGRTLIIRNGWASHADLSRLTTSMHALGQDARHAMREAPKNQMTIYSAYTLIRCIVIEWLDLRSTHQV